MQVLVLHSAVAADARPDDLDTLTMAHAVAAALPACGHHSALASFVPDATVLREQAAGFDAVFNLVETALGQDDLAVLAPALLAHLGIAFTGACAAAMMLTGDKPAAKRVLRAAGLAMPDWHEGPDWRGLDPEALYIVKAACADASLGLDDGAVVRGHAVPARADACAARYGGRWFAEAFIDGREFNLSLLDVGGNVRLLPIAEMRFVDWDETLPRIIGYRAKWDDNDPASQRTVRDFGSAREDRKLAGALAEAATKCWSVFGLCGYARVDVRVDAAGVPLILEVNTNPCLSPDAGFAAAAHQAGLSYPDLIDTIVRNARR